MNRGMMQTSMYNKILQELLNGLNILLVTGAYWLCWEYFYETQLRAPFYHWGNLIMVFLFGLFYYFTSHLYNGFTLHISRIYELVYSQGLAALISDGILYLITLLINRHYISFLPFLPTFLLQFFLITLWTVAAHQWYFRVFPPKKTVVILGPGPERGQTGETVRHGSPFRRPVRGHRGRMHGTPSRDHRTGRSGVLLRPSQP
jgi:hypothetical protein